MEKQLPKKTILQLKKKKMIVSVLMTMVMYAWLRQPGYIPSKYCTAFIFVVIYLITESTWNLWKRLGAWLVNFNIFRRKHNHNT